MKLQHYLLEAESQMGELEDWQRKIYVEEVVPQSSRFVRDYKSSVSGLEVDIDRVGVLNYLRFYAPKALGREKPEILIALRAEPECDKCQAALAEVKKLVKARVERRGWVPAWVTPAQLDSKLTGKALDERLSRLGSETKKPATLWVEWKKAISDEEDASHADELKFSVHTGLAVRGIGQQEGQLEIFETGNFEKTVAQLLTDLFTELGIKLEREAVRLPEADRSSYSLVVTGIRGFNHYLKVKNQVFQLAAGPSSGSFGSRDAISVEESKISRGKVVFNLFTQKGLDSVKELFARLSDEGSVRVEIQ